MICVQIDNTGLKISGCIIIWEVELGRESCGSTDVLQHHEFHLKRRYSKHEILSKYMK